MSTIKWGILGAGKIAFDFVQALRTLPAGEQEVVAVGSRSLERCAEFCRDLAIPKSYGSYEELCADPEVDVIYVASHNVHHASHVELALKYNKPCLCEKPISLNLPELQRISKMAREKEILLMEAVWTRFLPSWLEVLKMIKEGDIGEVRAVMGSFGALGLDKVERVYNPSLGGGVMLDVGIYLLNGTDMVFGGEEPLSITSSGHKFDTGIDHTVGITILYSGNRIAHLLTGAVADLPNDFNVIGTKGTVTIKPPFWCSEELESPGGPKRFPFPPTDKPTKFVNSAGLRYEITAFGEYVKNKKVESEVMPHATSERIMGWMDKIREQMDCPLS